MSRLCRTELECRPDRGSCRMEGWQKPKEHKGQSGSVILYAGRSEVGAKGMGAAPYGLLAAMRPLRACGVPYQGF
jgi:NAD(P)H-hydrate repair Nnr-like enzyme with NAD(P)H-hydrate dehydratase domain